MTVQPLFETFRHKLLVLCNSFVMDPITRTGSPSGKPEQDVASLYRRRTAYEVGLMLSEPAAVEREAAATDDHLPHFYGDQALSAWQQVHDGVRKAGAVMAPKLWHMGIVAPPRTIGGQAVSLCEGPSNKFGPGASMRNGHAMDSQAIADTIAAYGAAAQAAQRMGFVAVEIDAAFGGLIDQFFWPVTNDRTDDYGGATLHERSRFAQEVLQAVQRATSDDFTIILRLSQGKPYAPTARLANTCQEMEQWLTPLVDSGADILHCAQDRWYQPEFAGSPLNFAGWAKKITDLPVITSGNVGLGRNPLEELTHLTERKGRGEFDLIGLDRILAHDGAWVSRIKHGELEATQSTPVARVHLVV